jgi:hypothetical protein
MVGQPGGLAMALDHRTVETRKPFMEQQKLQIIKNSIVIILAEDTAWFRSGVGAPSVYFRLALVICQAWAFPNWGRYVEN